MDRLDFNINKSKPSCDPGRIEDGSPAENRFIVKMTDNPANLAGLEIEFENISAYSPVLGWIPLDKDQEYVDVLKLTNGNEVQIAHSSASISDFWEYTKLKINIGRRNRLLLWEKHSPFAVMTGKPVAQDFNDIENEVVVPLAEIYSKSGFREVLLDFDVVKSVRSNEKGYFLNPRIFEMANRTTGISGSITNSDRYLVYATDYTNTYSCYSNENGDFLIRGMKEGNYLVLIYSLNCSPNGRGYKAIIENVPVVSGILYPLSI